MVTVKNDAHRKHTAAKNHGVLFVENRVVKADFRSNREALFEEEVDIIFSHPLRTLFLFGDFFVMSKLSKKKEEEKICVVLFCIKIIMLKRRRGQNASINPALEHIEVDADILRASLTCELCKNILREANTVVCFLY
jgi:hypothetical protein